MSHRAAWLLLCGGALTLLAAILAWPAVLHPLTWSVGGADGDLPSVAWTLWWVAGSAPGLPPAHTELLLAPAGASLFPTALIQAWLLAPLTLALGPVASTNLLSLLAPALAAVAGAWLVWDEPAVEGAISGPAALVAGVCFGLGPVVTTAVANGNVDASPWFVAPLAAGLARRAHRGWAWAVTAGLVLGLAPAVSAYGAVGAAVLAVATLRRPTTPVGWARLGVAAGGGLALAAAYAGVVRRALAAPDALVDKAHGGQIAAGAVAHLSGFVVPADAALGTAGLVHGWHLPWVALGLAALGAGATWAQGQRGVVLRWLAVGLVGLVLAVGPQLHAVDPAQGGGIPLPWAPLFDLPGLDVLHLRYRFAALCALAVGALAALGTRALALRSGRGPTVVLGAAVLVAAELLAMGGGARHFAAAPVDLGGGQAVAGLATGAVLDLPLVADSRWLLHQTRHGRPIAAGINRTALPPVQQALAGPPERCVRRLASLGFSHVVLHADAAGPAVSAAEAQRTAAWLEAASAGRLDVVATWSGGVVIAVPDTP